MPRGPKGQKRPADVIGNTVKVMRIAMGGEEENHVHMVALYTDWYNWVRIHKTLRFTPAMAAGLTDKLLSMEDVAAMIEAQSAKPVWPMVYRKKQARISN